LKPGESKEWPVVFVIDPKLPKDVKTITLSYTFFEVAGKGGVKTARRRRRGARCEQARLAPEGSGGPQGLAAQTISAVAWSFSACAGARP
jgi:hypothetical protein